MYIGGFHLINPRWKEEGSKHTNGIILLQDSEAD